MKLKNHNHQALKIQGAWEYKRKKEKKKVDLKGLNKLHKKNKVLF